MGKNLVSLEFKSDSTVAIPAGVTEVRAIGYRSTRNYWSNGNLSHAIDYITGQLYSWGLGSNGLIGDNTIVSKSSPTLVVGGLKFIDVGFGCGIDEAGQAYCWGGSNFGSIGDNNNTTRSSPTAVVGGLKFKRIAAAGPWHRIALTHANDAYTWGTNTEGRLGDGTAVSKSSPVAVVGGLKFKEIAAGYSHSAGITESGDLYMWGLNDKGQLGDGTTVPKSSPVLVLGGLKFTKVALGQFYGNTFGLTEGKDIYAWGLNDKGQLGDGTTVPKSSPVLVVGGLKFTDIAANDVSICTGLTTSNDIYAWGDGGGGSLGDGTIVSKSSPVLVIGGLKFSALGGGGGQTANGDIYHWGYNTSGGVGDGTTTNRSSPVKVIGGRFFRNLLKSTMFDRMIPVTPGTTYDVKLSGAFASVGQNGLGALADTIVIQYYA